MRTFAEADLPLMDLPIALLKCPRSGSDLCALTASELATLREGVRGGAFLHADGTPVAVRIDGALAAERAPYLYLISDDVVLLLESLAVVSRDELARPRQLQLRKAQVSQFYDEVGWRRPSPENYGDSERWEDLRPVSADYIRSCHRRVGEYLPQTGEYFLDAASGPVQYEEYLEYSRGFRRRICVDISLQALREARRKLGPHGVYLLADVTRLPLKDNVIGAFVSLHTIYHVPADEQQTAFSELSRVLAPDGTGVVVYNWPGNLQKLMLLPAKAVRAPLRFVRKLLARRRDRQLSSRRRLYFHCHSYSWFASRDWEFEYEVCVWRSVSVDLLRTYFSDLTCGRLLLRLLYFVETRFPKLAGRWGAYPLIVLWKQATAKNVESREAA